MGVIATMGSNGHTLDTWAPEDVEGTAHARGVFEEMVGRRAFLAFRTDEHGGDPGQIREFDPDADKILLTPPMAGG